MQSKLDALTVEIYGI